MRPATGRARGLRSACAAWPQCRQIAGRRERRELGQGPEPAPRPLGRARAQPLGRGLGRVACSSHGGEPDTLPAGWHCGGWRRNWGGRIYCLAEQGRSTCAAPSCTPNEATRADDCTFSFYAACGVTPCRSRSARAAATLPGQAWGPPICIARSSRTAVGGNVGLSHRQFTVWIHL